MRIIYTFGDSHTCMFQEAYRRPGSVAPIDPKVVFLDRSSIASTRVQFAGTGF